ncbi:M14 family metallocarboxypeptidase [Variovorax sp. PCZ-1]|uniref:M14 family metallopeptidase n=1 Tax=Variovorax sp. PCZ-1 TaxID=2835533 RepID=UPI001BCB134E|nr:M14 family metallocarboxypeptidase [Variovorax sp. PCZ-1]MBS7807817.1 M14 family metallocarboxypeptidase [Variovorax sp. PCZ-1]
MAVIPFYPIGTPGQAWGAAEIALWRSQQIRQRSYADDVLAVIEPLRQRFDVVQYGQVVYGAERFPLMAVRSRDWQPSSPNVLITGGVHGYETSGVQGALRFLAEYAQAYAGRVNLLVAPCVSPWAYERVQRWNFDAIDPNRSFKPASRAQECATLMDLIAPLHGKWAMHLDLHETTETDESEFRPAVAARDGKAFEPGQIPDGFYAVCDAANPQLEFQSAIIEAVKRVTHIADADENGAMIGSPAIAPGVIAYELQALGLCASISGARYCTTTEVYPDSPRTTPEQCIEAQMAALCAGLDFLIKNG